MRYLTAVAVVLATAFAACGFVPATPAEEVLAIESWHWDPDANFGTQGAVIWTVELRNLTTCYIEQVRVDFTSYDVRGKVMDSDFIYVTGLSPGGTEAAKGYATYYGGEWKAEVSVDPVRLPNNCTTIASAVHEFDKAGIVHEAPLGRR